MAANLMVGLPAKRAGADRALVGHLGDVLGNPGRVGGRVGLGIEQLTNPQTSAMGGPER